MHIDWNTGTYLSDSTQPPEVRVTVAGDWAPILGFADRLIEDPQAVYGDLLPDLQHSDLRIVNLESPLTDSERPTWKDGPNLRGRPAAIAGLTAVPFDVACLANNHVFDFGPGGFEDTTRLLSQAGISTVGAGLSPQVAFAPLVVPVKGMRLGIVNFCEGEDYTGARDGPGVFGWEVERAAHTVQTLANEVDTVIVIAHCGREHTPLPPPYVVEAFRRIAEAGAHAVIGHHPHVPQGIEIHGGCPILYSVGNFVFDQSVDLFYRKAGYLVELHLSGSDLGFRLIPYRIGAHGLQKMVEPTRRWFLDRLRQASEPLGSAQDVRAAWAAFIDQRGEEGLQAELARMVTGQELSRKQWAALRNRFVTPAHRELWIEAATRAIEGQMGQAPEWARDLVEEWLTRPDLQKD